MFGGAPQKQKAKAKASKPGPARGNGAQKGKSRFAQELEDLQSKQDLLVALNRQADENTRILERERAKLGLPPPPPPPYSGNHQYQNGSPRQGPAAPPANQRRARNVFGDNAAKKVFDPSQVPGLGGGAGPVGVAPSPSGLSMFAQSPFNNTFPESPSFFPGMVFNVPGGSTMPQQPPPPPQLDMPPTVRQPPTMRNAPQQPASTQGLGPPPGDGATLPHYTGPRGGMPGPGMDGPGGTAVLGGYGPGPGPGSMGHGAYTGRGPAPPPLQSPLQPSPHPDPAVQARLEADAKKEAYRRELEEQIRQKQQAKANEAARRKAEDAAWEARNAAGAVAPWDPNAQRGGGGGDPHRDAAGRPVGDLRQRGPPSPHMAAPPPPPYGPSHPPGPPMSMMLGPPPGQYGMPGPQRPPPHPPEVMAPLPQQTRLAINVSPARRSNTGGPDVGYAGDSGGHSPGTLMAGGGGALTPGSIPPVSPGNRRFMAAMSDLLAGPTDEQRRAADEQRRKLQMDLEAQIREKKERQARERAQAERERMRDEGDFRAQQHDWLNGQKDQERRGNPGMPPGEPQMPSPPAQHPHMQQQQRLPSPGGRPGRRSKNRVIDAPWLDAARPPPLTVPPPPQMVPSPGRNSNPGYISPQPHGLSREPSQKQLAGLTPPPRDMGLLSPSMPMAQPQRRSNHGGGELSGGAPGVTGLLHQLHEEQRAMREEFSRQAAAMEKLAAEASRALSDRDDAWQELRRVKAMLGGGGEDLEPPLPGLRRYTSVPTPPTPVVVNTHLVPKTINAIPEDLPQPLVSEVLERGYTDPGPSRSHGGAGAYGGGGFDDSEFQHDLEAIMRGGGGGMPPIYSSGGGFQGAARRRQSGIPLPPGLGGGGGGGGNPFGRPPVGGGHNTQSRYNSFFGLNEEMSAGGGGGGGGGMLPPVAPRRGLTVTVKPSSPAILRGDHLPSPTKGHRERNTAKPGAHRMAREGPPPNAQEDHRRDQRGGGGGAAVDRSTLAGNRRAGGQPPLPKGRPGERLARTGHMPAGSSPTASADDVGAMAQDQQERHGGLAAKAAAAAKAAGLGRRGGGAPLPPRQPEPLMVEESFESREEPPPAAAAAKLRPRRLAGSDLAAAAAAAGPGSEAAASKALRRPPATESGLASAAAAAGVSSDHGSGSRSPRGVHREPSGGAGRDGGGSGSEAAGAGLLPPLPASRRPSGSIMAPEPAAGRTASRTPGLDGDDGDDAAGKPISRPVRAGRRQAQVVAAAEDGTA